jgi:hypothetical protein
MHGRANLQIFVFVSFAPQPRERQSADLQAQAAGRRKRDSLGARRVIDRRESLDIRCVTD